MDIVTPEQRSRIMRAVRQKDTKPELTVRRLLHAMGYRYRLHAAELPGKPDIVFRKHRTAIFVHGCFWHRHKGCKVATTPKSNTSYWVEKFNRNVARDAMTTQNLKAAGWRVIVAWECELGSTNKVAAKAYEIAREIRGG
jgi:DNA mismatch endonuclease (patch repair protein)